MVVVISFIVNENRFLIFILVFVFYYSKFGCKKIIEKEFFFIFKESYYFKILILNLLIIMYVFMLDF